MPKACTLAETVYDMVERKEMHGDAFKALLAYWGREKLKALYLGEKHRRMQLASRYAHTHASQTAKDD